MTFPDKVKKASKMADRVAHLCKEEFINSFIAHDKSDHITPLNSSSFLTLLTSCEGRAMSWMTVYSLPVTEIIIAV